MLEKGSVAVPSVRNGRMGPRWSVMFLEVNAGPPTAVTALNSEILWWEMHWTRAGHQPCLAPTGDCPFCSKQIPTLPHGYLSVVNQRGGTPAILHVTARMWNDLPAIHNRGSIQGANLVLWRCGNHRSAKVSWRMDGAVLDLSRLPKPLDVDRYLRVLFSGADRRQLAPTKGGVE
jgi:hypothetical protein